MHAVCWYRYWLQLSFIHGEPGEFIQGMNRVADLIPIGDDVNQWRQRMHFHSWLARAPVLLLQGILKDLLSPGFSVSGKRALPYYNLLLVGLTILLNQSLNYVIKLYHSPHFEQMDLSRLLLFVGAKKSSVPLIVGKCQHNNLVEKRKVSCVYASRDDNHPNHGPEREKGAMISESVVWGIGENEEKWFHFLQLPLVCTETRVNYNVQPSETILRCIPRGRGLPASKHATRK